MKQNIAVGVDIGTSYTRVVVVETSSVPNSLPVILGTGIAETKGVQRGYIVNQEDVLISLKKALRDAEKESGQRIKSASVAIGGLGIGSQSSTGSSIVSRADGIINKLDIEKSITDAESKLDLKNKVILHAFPILFKVDGKEIPGRPEGISGIKIETKVLFVTCFQQHYEDVLSVVSEAGVRITQLTASNIAVEKLLLSDVQRNFGCALIDIGSETAFVSVYENNHLTSMKVFGIGSFDITKDIALGLRVTPEEAENIKIGAVSFQNVSKRKLEEIIEARLSDIFELIDKYFKKIGRSELLPSGVIIIGGGSHTSMIESVAKNMLKIPARVGYVSLPMQSSKNELKSSRDQRLLVSFGAAFTAMNATSSKNSKDYGGDGDSFWSIIKNFIKQLMP